MRIKKNWLIIVIGLLLATVIVSTSPKYSGVLHCIFIEQADLKRLNDHLYIDPKMSQEELELFAKRLAEGTARAKKIYKELNSKPIIIAGDEVNTLKDFGLSSRGVAVSHNTIFSDYIIVGPNGMDSDVIAYEISHNELVDRVGWINIKKIPAWFDEGLAMQLDERVTLTENEWENRLNRGAGIPNLSYMNTPEEFGTGDTGLNYAAAKYEVKRWLAVVGQNGLQELIQKIKKGEDFYQSYKAVEYEWKEK